MPPEVAPSPSGSLADAIGGMGATLARELPAAFAEDRQNRRIVQDATISAVNESRAGRAKAESLATPPMPPPQPPPQYQETSTTDRWGSLAMLMATLGSGMTRRPAIASLNAAAGVLNAYNDSDAAAYKRNFDRWKAETDYSLKMYEYQRDAYKDALANIKDNSAAAMAEARSLAAAFKDDTVHHLASMGNVAGVLSTIQERNEKLPLLRAETEIARTRGELVNRFNAARDKLRANPTDPAALAELQTIELESKALRAIEGKQSYSPTEAKDSRVIDLHDRLVKEWKEDPKNAGKEVTAEKDAEFWAMAQGSMAGRSSASQSGTLSDEAANLLADQFILGDTQAITSLPRSGPARVKVENRIAEKMREMPEAARDIAMNRMRMAEARSAATTAGRVTMNTELFAQEARMAGAELERVSAQFPRGEFPLVNTAIQAYERNTGDPKIIAFGVALNALRNAYGKMSNPTGTGVHDADKAQFQKIMDTALSHGQIKAGVEQIIREGAIMSNAARKAQEEVIGHVVPHSPGAATPAAAPPAAAAPAPATAPPAPSSGPPTITNQQEYDALPPGAEYLDVSGKRYRKK